MFPVWADLYSVASHDEEASHLFLVPFVFAWLLWCSRDRIMRNTVEHSVCGLVVIVAALVLQEVGLTNNLQALWHASAVVSLIGAMWLVMGTQTIRSVWPAIAVLLFLIPIPGLLRQQLSLSVQMYSASVAESVLTFVGTDVECSGCVLFVDNTAVTVAEACNGMRMMFAVLLVVYALAFSLTRNRKTQAAILILSPLAAMLINVVRLSISAWTFGVCCELVAQQWHDISGWLMPGMLMLAIIWLTDTERESAAASNNKQRWSAARPRTVTGVAAALLLVSVVWNSRRVPDRSDTMTHHSRVSHQLTEFSYSVDDWLGIPGEMQADELRLLQPIAAFRRRYSNIETGERLSVVAVLTETARDLVGHEPGICLTGQGWNIVRQTAVSWAIGSSQVYGRTYQFSSGSDANLCKQVANILLVAGGESSGNMATVADAAADFRRAPYGACSLQISSDRFHSNADWARLTEPFVAELFPVVHSFAACPTETAAAQLIAYRSVGSTDQGGIQ